jgi:hypothetical protein
LRKLSHAFGRICGQEERGEVWTVTRRWQLSGPNDDGSAAKELARDIYGEAK